MGWKHCSARASSSMARGIIRSRCRIRKNPDCPWHDEAADIVANADLNSDVPLRHIWDEAAKILGAVDALDLSREVVSTLHCPKCDRRDAIYPAGRRK